MSSTERPVVATLATGVQLGLALAILAASWGPASAVIRALRGPVTFDDAPSLAWLIGPAVALAIAAARLIGYIRGAPVSARASWASVIALASVIAGRVASVNSGEAGYTTLEDAPPTIQTVEALKKMRACILDAEKDGAPVPGDEALRAALMVDGRELRPSYLYRGLRRRPFALVRVTDARGPVRQRRPEDLAGTIYLAVDPDRIHFWLTAVVLFEEHGVTASDMMPASNGLAVLTNAG